MITCKCGKTIDKVPEWMQAINVEFVCNNCPNRQAKNIALAAFETALPAIAKLDDEDEVEVEEAAPETEPEPEEALPEA